MAALLPVAVYGLEVPADDIAVEADGSVPYPVTFRVTMAAIDPSAEVAGDVPKRATLKLIKIRAPDFGDEDDEDDDYDDDDIAAIKRRLGMASDDDSDEDEDEDEDDEKNGGPSDPEKSKKARKEALIEALKKDEELEDIELTNGINGTNSGKGKAKVTDEDEVEDEDEEDNDDEDIKEYVVCTLDPERNYQQPLDITINNDIEMCYFKATGPYKIYLTGNFCIPPEGESDDYEEDEDEAEEDLEGLEALDAILAKGSADDVVDSDEDDEEEDELDDLEDPRIMEVDEDEEDAPKLLKAANIAKKGKNKRPAEEDEDDEDVDVDTGDILKKILKPEEPKEKLSKSQKKKLKNNAGQAVPTGSSTEKDKTPTKVDKAKEAPNKDSPANGKKVQFAKNLEQGPTPPKTKTVEGVTIDDRKIGQGKPAKKGDRVQLRYIGKTKDGKQFDANKKGKPFSFKIGDGSVIKGWDIGIQGMAVGGERRIVIPPKLAYGNKSMGGIPSNSELTFDLKLISIE